MNIAVFGGVNMDILGMPATNMRLRDSVPGRVVLRPGGVGGNIARGIAALGEHCQLFTAFGDDFLSQTLMDDCQARGIDIRHALRVKGRSCVYLCVHDNAGDMLAAVNDMALTERLSPDYAARSLALIKGCAACVLDANIPKDTLDYVAERAGIPLLLDPVSRAKAARVLDALPHMTAIKPNLAEARAMTGADTPQNCAARLLKNGVDRVFISLGADGLYYADAAQSGLIPAKKSSAADTTGAGDALCAGLAVALARGEGTRRCAEMGMESAARYLAEKAMTAGSETV